MLRKPDSGAYAQETGLLSLPKSGTGFSFRTGCPDWYADSGNGYGYLCDQAPEARPFTNGYGYGYIQFPNPGHTVGGQI